MAVSVVRAHGHSMAKTWMPKNDKKLRKVFDRVMRALLSNKNRRNHRHSR